MIFSWKRLSIYLRTTDKNRSFENEEKISGILISWYIWRWIITLENSFLVMLYLNLFFWNSDHFCLNQTDAGTQCLTCLGSTQLGTHAIDATKTQVTLHADFFMCIFKFPFWYQSEWRLFRFHSWTRKTRNKHHSQLSILKVEDAMITTYLLWATASFQTKFSSWQLMSP